MAMNPQPQSSAQVGSGQNFTPASLYVGELKPEVTEAFLFEMFNTVGPVASIRVCRDVVTRRSLGYAYVNFHSINDAERALDTMNFSMIRGHPCRIMWSQRDPSLRKSGVGNIFVKNLDKSIDHKTLYDTFSMFGSILSCKVATDENGESRGYGFVHYESQESADRAIQKVDGMVIAAREVHVKPFLPKSQRSGANDASSFTNLYIKGLDKENVDEKKLEEMFGAFGKINSHYLARDKEQKSRGFGFVNFEKSEDARAAMDAMNEKDGLTVCRAQKREERDRVLRQSFEKLRLEQAEKYAGVNLYIKRLDDTLTDADLEKEFAVYGAIESAKIMRTPDGRSKGFGFVMFQSRDAAAKAVAEMNGKMLKQKPLYVALAQGKEERRQFLEAQAQVNRNKMATMPHQMYGPPHTGPQGHPGMYYQGGPQGMPQGPGGPQGPHGMPPGTPMGVAPQMPRGGAQTPQGFMYGAPHNQMGMNDPRGPQGGMGGPQGGRGGPWGQGPRTPNGPNMMMNNRGPVPNMYGMMGNNNMHQGGRGGGRGRGRGRGGQGGDRGGIQFQHNVRNNPQQQPTQQGPPAGAVPQQQNGVPPQGGAAAQQPTAAAANATGGPAAAQQQQQAQQPAAAPGPLTSQALARAPAQQQKQMIGERIYPKIQEIEPVLAGKITGMLLEMDNTELLHLLESPEALRGKITEAMTVLQQSGDAPKTTGAAAGAAASSGGAAADPAAAKAASGDDGDASAAAPAAGGDDA